MSYRLVKLTSAKTGKPRWVNIARVLDLWRENMRGSGDVTRLVMNIPGYHVDVVESPEEIDALAIAAGKDPAGAKAAGPLSLPKALRDTAPDRAPDPSHMFGFPG